MKTYDLQSVEIAAKPEEVFLFVAERAKLPQWTEAFVSIDDGEALMRTPEGEVRIGLDVKAEREAGTVDWVMRFPDGAAATAYSRVVSLGDSRSVFQFLLPSVEGNGAETVARELQNLKTILEA